MAATPPRGNGSRGRQPGRCILVADRDESSRITTASILRRLGFHVVEAGSADQALANAQQVFSCAIFDLNLAELSTFAVCRRLLDDDVWAATPLVFTSSRQPQPDLRLLIDSGGFPYLSKPFRSDHLMAAVGDALAGAATTSGTVAKRRQILEQAAGAAPGL